MLLHLRLSPHAFKRFTDNADATDFIFSQILFLLVLPLDIGFTTDCFCAYTALDYLQQEIIRENPSARQAQTNHNWIKKSVKRTDPSHQRYPWLILNVASEPKASEHILWGTVFQTALPYFLNTRDFVPGYSRCARYWLPAKSCSTSRISGWYKISINKNKKKYFYWLIFYFYLLIFYFWGEYITGTLHGNHQ